MTQVKDIVSEAFKDNIPKNQTYYKINDMGIMSKDETFTIGFGERRDIVGAFLTKQLDKTTIKISVDDAGSKRRIGTYNYRDEKLKKIAIILKLLGVLNVGKVEALINKAEIYTKKDFPIILVIEHTSERPTNDVIFVMVAPLVDD